MEESSEIFVIEKARKKCVLQSSQIMGATVVFLWQLFMSAFFFFQFEILIFNKSFFEVWRILSLKKGENSVYYNQVIFSSIQSFCLWQMLMLPSLYFLAGNPYFNQVVFWRSLVNFIVENKEKKVSTIIVSKLRSIQSFLLLQLLMLAIFLFITFLARNPYSNPVDF